MKLLLDTCVWGGVLAEVQAAGHDVVWVGHWDADPGDEEILARALAEGRILVTLDNLVFARHRPHGGIIRLVNFPARQQARACLHVLGLHGTELEAGALVTAEPGVLRIRLPDPTNGPGSP